MEYPIPRRGRRIDAVIIIEDLIIVVEFKCGARKYDRLAQIQLEDYCLDLRDFHSGSRRRLLIPILIATRAADSPAATGEIVDSVAPIWFANASTFAEVLVEASAHYRSQDLPSIDAERWDQAEYLPTPTIVEAARVLYEGQNVREISRCHAGAENLTRTSAAVISAIEKARRDERKLICFVTGVPGAGKTLAAEHCP